MRKFNTILVLIIMILLLDHIIFGGLHLLGAGTNVFKPVALLMLILVFIHAVVSMIITIRAEKAGMKTKARYNEENKQFWSRRTSGMAIVVFALMHAHSMIKDENGVPNIARLPKFFNLALPLLILSVGLHLISNVKPLLISLGIKIGKKEIIINIIILLITLFAMFALIYFVINRMGINK